MSANPQLFFVAGPNGAGKSTFSKKFSEPGAVIFDVDKLIARIEGQSRGFRALVSVVANGKRVTCGTNAGFWIGMQATCRRGCSLRV